MSAVCPARRVDGRGAGSCDNPAWRRLQHYDLALCPARWVDIRRAKPCDKSAISGGLEVLGLSAQPAGLMSDGHSLAIIGQAGAREV